MKFITNTSDLAKFLNKKIKFNALIKSISTDTRSLKKNSLFIAIKGENFDGNDFVDEALSKGSNIIIADNKRFKNNKDKRIIWVNDSIKALKTISNNIIKDYGGNVIAITGSNGKTTTTNIIGKTLKNNSKTLKNFNNEIGMPLSLMNASSKSKNLIFEIGASKLNDIDYLSKILRPNVGLITNIGNSHLESLKNIDGVFKVKSEIVKNIKKNGFLVVPNDNKKHLNKWKKMRSDITTISFGMKDDSDFYPIDVKIKQNGLSFLVTSRLLEKPIKISSSLEGVHNVKNILSACAVHYCLGQNLQDFSKSISLSKLDNLRQVKYKWLKGSTLIDDSYNANPDSTKKSIDLLSNYNKKTVLLLGDMLELGRYKNKLHKEVGEYAKSKGISKLIAFGNLTRHSIDGFGKNGIFFNDETKLKNYLRKNITSKNVILIKGSRGMKMERFIDV
jgi:UDP-N-acetylmuramoyl-tripeptide--D-alanyl-D-alanine ligase